MYAASFEARNSAAAAISFACPMRPIGICFFRFCATSWFSSAVISVSMNPGAIALTVMPLEATSFAIDFPSPMIPAFAAA